MFATTNRGIHGVVSSIAFDDKNGWFLNELVPNLVPFVAGKKKGLKAKCRKSLISFGGAKRDRTADLLNAIQALSQLSYSPEQVQIYSREVSGCQLLFYSVSRYQRYGRSG